MDENTSDKLSNLTSVSYYNNPIVSKNSIAVEAESDTTNSETELTGVKDPDKVHYGIPVDQLEKYFPELVYEQADGDKCVNYIEMIPLLVQSIKELSNKVEKLEERLSNK